MAATTLSETGPAAALHFEIPGCSELLRDNDPTTFWQSDGTQPHFITLQFPQLTEVQTVALYLDYQQDESYTPKDLSIYAGHTTADLQKVLAYETEEPTGWVQLDLTEAHQGPLSLFTLRIMICSNHQFGKDCHVRQVKVFAPHRPLALDQLRYTSLEFKMASQIR
ncbi:Anaphase-promoting complex subunit 10 [Tieghemiomyces parasiticus]|uniref:Anaphase-promoting complex subunit 10 n=1 Tax=Tieghemiomyces parasiticus TaxID=78921 RepID=A0A9W8ACL0_9FUNG|nr:Anaphase-promoting complex subunit 10 [Tieghemiomyces parasiticus]